MTAERLSMRKIKELLRLDAEGLSEREISRSLKVSRSTVQRYRRRVEEAGLTWPLPEEFTDSEIEARLFPPPPAPDQPRPLPAWRDIDQELRRRGVTLQLLWDEYRGSHPDTAYSYNRFCELFGEWKGTLDVVLRQEYKAGERTFVDYAGQTMPVVDQQTGEIREAQIFVGALGASNYTYAEATWTQSLPDWIGSHVRMFAYYGGVSELVVPDNLRSAVRRACRYDPDTVVSG